jgi:hypothetical protein
MLPIKVEFPQLKKMKQSPPFILNSCQQRNCESAAMAFQSEIAGHLQSRVKI